MPDISMCMNEDCPLKNKCYRFTAIPNPYRQSYAGFELERDDCYWDDTEYTKNFNENLDVK